MLEVANDDRECRVLVDLDSGTWRRAGSIPFLQSNNSERIVPGAVAPAGLLVLADKSGKIGPGRAPPNPATRERYRGAGRQRAHCIVVSCYANGNSSSS